MSGERCALAASSGLVNCAPDQPSKTFLATQTLAGTIADERRHVGFGENRIGSLIVDHPERKADVERMQGEMSYHMLAAFADVFSGSGPTMDEERRRTAADSGDLTPMNWHGTDLTDGPRRTGRSALLRTRRAGPPGSIACAA